MDGFAVTSDAAARRSSPSLEANRHLGSPMDAVLQVVSPDGVRPGPERRRYRPRPEDRLRSPLRQGPTSFASSPSPPSPIAASDSRGATTFVYRLTLTTGGFLDYAFPLAVGRDGPKRSRRSAGTSPPTHDFCRLAECDARDEFDGLPSLPGRHRRGPPGSLRRGGRNRAQRPGAPPGDHGPGRAQRPDRPGGRPGRLPPLAAKGRQARDSASSPRAWEGRSTRSSTCSTPAARSSPSRTTRAGTAAISSGRSPHPPMANTGSWCATSTAEGGPRSAYLLSVFEPQPDFALTLTADRFDLTPGKPTKITVAIQRKDGDCWTDRDQRRRSTARNHGADRRLEARRCFGAVCHARTLSR